MAAPLSALACPRCGRDRVETRDAIGRPRLRCPDCQGVVLAPAVPTAPLHRQSAMDSRSLAWPSALEAAHLADRVAAAARGRSSLPPLHCRDCGVELPRSGARGRPRVHCEDRAACRARTRGAA